MSHDNYRKGDHRSRTLVPIEISQWNSCQIVWIGIDMEKCMKKLIQELELECQYDI